jgi:acyl-lipid omega-6 desaturase (Delta-12 desaturase)
MGSNMLPRPRKQSLNDIRAAIPARYYEPLRARGVLVLLQAAILYLVPLTLLALTDQWWAVPLLWVAVGLAIAGLFVLGHDASHGALFASRRVNHAVAVVCMVPSAHVEAAWNLGHNRIHHG